jgi:nicotinamide-nucleotide amidase
MPGISAVFDRGFVTYSNEAKMQELGVKEETLIKHGAVSSETAVEMAKGLRARTGSDVCVSVTGIAGPGGGTPEKPVGLVYMSIYFKETDRQITKKRNLSGTRDEIRNQTADIVLETLLKEIE